MLLFCTAAEITRAEAKAAAIASGVAAEAYVEDAAVSAAAAELHGRALRLFAKAPLTILLQITSTVLAARKVSAEIGPQYYELAMKVTISSFKCLMSSYSATLPAD